MTSLYQRKNGLWCGKWKDSSGKWRYVYRKDEQAARDALEAATQNGHTPALQNRTTTQLSVSKYLDQWLADIRGVVSERSYAARTSIIENHLRPGLGHIPVDKVTANDVKALYRSRSHLAPRTVRNIHGLLRQVLGDAMREELIASNVAVGIRLPRYGHDDMKVLGTKQVKALLDAAKGERFEHVIVVMATCGLRLGEALALTRECVDIEGGVLTVRHTLYRGRLCDCKTRSSRRTLNYLAQP